MKNIKLKKTSTKDIQINFKMIVTFGSTHDYHKEWVKRCTYDSYFDEGDSTLVETLMSTATDFIVRHTLMSGIEYTYDESHTEDNDWEKYFTRKRRLIFGDGISVITKYSEIISHKMY